MHPYFSTKEDDDITLITKAAVVIAIYAAPYSEPVSYYTAPAELVAEPTPTKPAQVVKPKVVATAEQTKKTPVNKPTTNLGEFTVTAYTANQESTGKSPGHPAYGITASGTKVQAGKTIACSPDIPFGTRLRIEDVGERVCQDRGGAIEGKRIDLYVEDYSDAIQFGKRTLNVSKVN